MAAWGLIGQAVPVLSLKPGTRRQAYPVNCPPCRVRPPFLQARKDAGMEVEE